MYIEFELSSGAGGAAAMHQWFGIRKSVQQWAKQHQVQFQTKVVKYTGRIVFDDDAMCDFFVLSYTGLGKYRIVDPLNNLT